MHKQQITRWNTEASDVSSLTMIRLVDEGGPLIMDAVEGAPPQRHFQFTFSEVFGYRKLKEEYLANSLRRDADGLRLGWTLLVEGSLWVSALAQEEPIFVLHGGEKAVHSMICTEDAVLEVLSKKMPVLSLLR